MCDANVYKYLRHSWRFKAEEFRNSITIAKNVIRRLKSTLKTLLLSDMFLYFNNVTQYPSSLEEEQLKRIFQCLRKDF